jgi:hypothetical protein
MKGRYLIFTLHVPATFCNNCDYIKIRKEVAEIYLKIWFQHLPGNAMVNHEKTCQNTWYQTEI